MKEFKKELGKLLMIIGAIILILSFFLGWNNNNAVLSGSLGLIVLGIVVYIIMNKKHVE
jgi:uncharacterized membrane-anchored protein YitT (DUF2179 family)